MIESSDYYLNEQLQRLLMKYKESLTSLKCAYRLKLKPNSEDFNNSIKENEDGFFLRLYSFIREC